MPAFTNLVNALVAVGAKPFATTMQALRDNPLAIAEKDPTVPTNYRLGLWLLGTITTTSGNSQTLSSLTLTDYTALLLVANGVSLSGPGELRLSSVGGPICSAQTAGTAGLLIGTLHIDLATSIFGSTITASDNASLPARSGLSTINNASTSLTVATPGVGTTFDAGSIRVYGVR